MSPILRTLGQSFIVILLGGCLSQPSSPVASRSNVEFPGHRADGSVLLPNQWLLHPVGKQVVLGDFPVNIALHPEGKFAAVLHAGHGQNEVIVVELPGGKLVSRVALDEAFYGISFTADGKRLFCSGAGSEVIHAFDFNNGFPASHQQIKLRPEKERGVPAGLALSHDATKLFVANVWGQQISLVELSQTPQVTDVVLSTNMPFITTNATNTLVTADEAAISKRVEALLEASGTDAPFPYACVLDEKQRRLFISFWGQSRVGVFDLKSQKITQTWRTEEHPNEMLLSKSGNHLFVANANRNTVSVLDTRTGKVIETLLAELLPNAPPGATPNSLALTPDEKVLFVANANINAISVFDVSELGKSRSLGFIPVGWYPTSVRVTPDGKRLLVANGKGAVSRANRHGPQPGREPPATIREYIGSLFPGTLSIIDLPARERLEERMKSHTARAYRCLPQTITKKREWETADLYPIPFRRGDRTPLRYCIYIIKENRTYDQVLGDMPEGNGDPSLCLFPERITPNHHQIARDFVLLDNFYVESEVSADGHEWTVGAYATDFVEKTWPLSYGHNKHKKYPYPAEGNFAIAAPAGGYIWDRAREAGVTYRSYGEFINNGKTVADPGTSRVATLQGHFDPWYRGFDMDYPDVLRAERFISELKRFEREGEMPQLQLVRLPSDHTSGATVGKLTPTAQVADNDKAFGMIIEALTHSRFWPEMAIFVVEDDAQNGPDHVDAHRTIAYVISPYARRGAVDSTLYSTSSMLRTMELILGLKPMSQFDAVAMPMFNSFQPKADHRPYRALPVHVDMNERNTTNSWGAALSQKMDFSKEDAADDLLLNEVVWRSVRGPDSPMPAPTRAGFVFTHNEEDEDE